MFNSFFCVAVLVGLGSLWADCYSEKQSDENIISTEGPGLIVEITSWWERNEKHMNIYGMYHNKCNAFSYFWCHYKITYCGFIWVTIMVVSLALRQTGWRNSEVILNDIGKIACVPFYLHDLTLIPAWINNYIHYKVWGVITYPLLNFNGCTVEV